MAVVFDRLSIESRKLAVDAMRRYIGDGHDSANIVGVFDIDLALRILQPFTRDAEAIRASLAKVSATRRVASATRCTSPTCAVRWRRGWRVGASGGRPADDLTVSMTDLFDGTLGQLQAEYGGSTTVHGLAAIVAGLSRRARPQVDPACSARASPLSRDGDPRFYALIDQANRANVAVYTVDAAGLRAGSYNLLAGRYAAAATNDAGGFVESPRDFATVARGAPEVGLGILANETGGQLIDSTNDLFKAFPRLDEDLRSYYALTYVPSAGAAGRQVPQDPGQGEAAGPVRQGAQRLHVAAGGRRQHAGARLRSAGAGAARCDAAAERAADPGAGARVPGVARDGARAGAGVGADERLSTTRATRPPARSRPKRSC